MVCVARGVRVARAIEIGELVGKESFWKRGNVQVVRCKVSRAAVERRDSSIKVAGDDQLVIGC